MPTKGEDLRVVTLETRKRQKLQRKKLIDGVEVNRTKLWRYCKSAFGMSKHRAKQVGVKHDIDAGYIDELLISQGYRCAVSGIVLQVSSERFGGAWGPSLDRIVPSEGYTRGNVRVVCQIVNVAMNSWGLVALERLVAVMHDKSRREKCGSRRA